MSNLPQLTLYQDKSAPNPRRVRMFAHEKGITLALANVSMAAFEHKGDEHTARHPLQQVPVLQLEDGRLLRESVAICRYLEGVVPSPNLFGEDAYEQAVIEMWSRHAEFELALTGGIAFKHGHPANATHETQVADIVPQMKAKILRAMDWFNSELAHRDFLAGRFSVADIIALTAIEFNKVSGVRVSAETQPHLHAWVERMKARPSYKA